VVSEGGVSSENFAVVGNLRKLEELCLGTPKPTTYFILDTIQKNICIEKDVFES